MKSQFYCVIQRHEKKYNHDSDVQKCTTELGFHYV